MRFYWLAGFFVLTCAGVSLGQDSVQLQGTRTIYVDSLGDDSDAAAIRRGITDRLTKAGRFEVVESADKADAVLSGGGNLTTTRDPTTRGTRKRTHFHAAATVQLKDKDQKLLWSKDEQYDSISHKLSTEGLGRKIAEDLVKDATPKKK